MAVEFSAHIAFDLKRDDHLDPFEYFLLARYAIIQVHEKGKGSRESRASEIAGIVATVVKHLDRRYSRELWTALISQEVDIWQEEARGGEAMTWEEVILLFPNIYDFGYHEFVLTQLRGASPEPIKSARRLVFSHDSGDEMNFEEAFALCRAFVRTELERSVMLGQFDLQKFMPKLIAGIDGIDRGYGKGWVERVWPMYRRLQKMPTDERTAIIHSLPILSELGVTRKAVRIWTELSANQSQS